MKIVVVLALALAITTCASQSASADCARTCYGQPYVTHTCVVCAHTECRWAQDHCGRHYSYEVRVVTYRSYFSNGQTSTYTRTYRA